MLQYATIIISGLLYFYICAKNNNKRMKRFILLASAIILISYISFSQEKVKWIKIDNLNEDLKNNTKPVFIDAYTDWCSWCKRLDADTFSNPVIAAYLNEKFIPVKFNAESKAPITFMGKEFVNDGKAGRAHQLAVALMQGQMSYPTVVFLNNKGELLSPVPGYRGPKDFEPLLVFFGEEKYLTEKWEDFSRNFKGSFE